MTRHSNRSRPLIPELLGLAFALCIAARGLAEVSIEWVEPTAGIAIAIDSSDSVYTVNYAYALGGDVTLTKRSSAGEFVWSATYDNTQSPFWERASWVATDHEDNVFVTGTIMSGYSNPVEAASAITKYDSKGGILWRHVYESRFDGSSTRKCLVDPSGNVYVLGKGSGPSGVVTKVKKFAPDGAALWSWFDDAGIGAPINFKFTPDGCLAIPGRAIFGSINGYAKVTLEGETIWSRPGVQSLTVGDCAGDAMGNTYLVHGEFVMNGGTVVRKLDALGTELWQETYGLAGFRIDVGTDHRAVVSGFPNPNMGGAAFIKIDEDGRLLWQNLDADGPGLGLLLHAQMLLDEENNAYLAAGTLFEMAVCKVASDGASDWTATMPGGYANAIAFGHDDAHLFVVGGNTAGLLDLGEPNASDLDGDGFVNGSDLGALLLAWGPCIDRESCLADLTGDGIIDGADLGALLLAWTN